jgi:hypothetical protein
MIYVKKNKLYKMSVNSVTSFHWAKISETVLIKPSFNELGIFNNFCVCTNVCVCVLIIFVFVNMVVFKVNELVISFYALNINSIKLDINVTSSFFRHVY